MRDACFAAQRVAAGSTRESLEQNETVVFALTRTVEIIGEAAGKVSKELREQYPEIAWSQIVAMRNRLIHAYFDVDLDQVWNAVTQDIPLLITALEKLIPPESSTS